MEIRSKDNWTLLQFANSAKRRNQVEYFACDEVSHESELKVVHR